ncbi:hypothetical protein BOQ63_005505 (plasmid) [Streptomyces viridifaciens]|nr:hypothetical protein BOQ63_005505 [Streptomyces viridifaciens]
MARLLPGAYVEGYALAGDGTVQAHAWCSASDGTVLDPARDSAALAYLGVPMSWGFVRAFQQRTLTKTWFRGVLDQAVQARDAERILRSGVPLHGVLDCGHVPPAVEDAWSRPASLPGFRSVRGAGPTSAAACLT